MPIPHDFPFDPTYGYTLEELLDVSAPRAPEDFERFWIAAYADAMRIPLHVERQDAASPHPDYEVYTINFNSLDGVRIGGWLTVPRNAEAIRCGVVVGHGYGGREAPAFSLPFKDAVAIFPCARGFHRSAHPDIPDSGEKHVLHGIERRESYAHLGSVVDYWLAASVLLEYFPEVRDRLYYQGGSFGGGIGALMLPWDARFTRAFLDVPSFGNHPLRVTLPCEGSGKAVKARYDSGDRGLLEVLRYFDAATAARYIDIPVFVAAAVFDPAVPPPGQFSVYNALRGSKELFLRQAAHFDLPGNAEDDAAIHARLLRWFASGA